MKKKIIKEKISQRQCGGGDIRLDKMPNILRKICDMTLIEKNYKIAYISQNLLGKLN